MVSLKIENQDRLKIIKKIDEYVKMSDLTGLLVTGSLAWGKNYAVSSTSDIDFYLLAPSIESFKSSIKDFPCLPQETISTLGKMLNFTRGRINTRSMKTDIDKYYGTVYLFIEKDFLNLIQQFDASHSKFFKNLRPHDKPQTKEYKDFNDHKLIFATPILKANEKDQLWIRTDPIFLFESRQFYGSIFLSHLLFGETYSDKNNLIQTAQIKARNFLKLVLPKQKDEAFIAFKNYLPRVERMNNDTINALFETIWLS